MASTRFYDDYARIGAALELQTQAGRYALNTPGNGLSMPYQEDVHYRLQRWGANLDRNQIDLENDLQGKNRPLVSKDAFVRVYHNMPPEYAKSAGAAFARKFPTAVPYTDESRATHPAWTYREASMDRWEAPFINPQANVELRFPNNLQTRIIEKDNHRDFYPTV
jgi:hypothetical protein